MLRIRKFSMAGIAVGALALTVCTSVPLTVTMNGSRPPSDVAHPGTIPSGRSGRHMILAVWTIADTGNAFYQCSDVSF
ncbi:putative carbohydrate-binding protein with CBM5 and CBM33 domain [Kribbella aluminosa]|uniref:Carbohydrate-binding protein with CBM5 and CBM33 domain n=1 Tax=Kribbella aluminosa TaxID=416017 RepID=A0ABS4UXF5_9ACTN|nr:lytic polysaccharide monooxygenase [Kribbella aluminosa]MBP2356297.1 putative carbohydrate-binding protein with CBM5 and CBM33 domain [Kribbella aluminosa]